ncbi:hypothetical protein GFC01_15930 [Desulfofundulus thermobenzoicus]|uniref:GH18 domain-containing protein n=1 Tax=Desulfofundulus thermobenzoicus TaxID=29376 RepID=A0A6N7IUZ2_9FIRM|nr:glycosyl hydrolase family 18 protein [Desulfofundulus thermobenzoicus]MQL53721.1 hypothetical protein [Desulfofundulus thermobenzoicus]
MDRKGTGKITVAALLIFTLFALVPVSYAGQYLRQGDYGPEVAALQQQLQKLGYLAAPATGYFGPLTYAAVTRLQVEHQLQPDGIVGPLTRNVMGLLLAGNRQDSPPPATDKSRKTVMGYYTGEEWPIPSSLESLRTNGRFLTYVAPFRYRLHPAGTGALETMADIPDRELNQLMTIAREKNVGVLPLIHNMLYGNGIQGRDVAHRILTDPQKRRTLVDNIYALVRDKGFQGVEIDIEDIYVNDSQLFNQFIAELSAKFKPAGYYLSVALPARISDTPNMSWSDSFDYSGVGRYADQVVIMAYDEHGAYSYAGPIASLPWVEKVVRYTTGKIPPEKVLLGLPAYGFDWNFDGGSPRYVSYQMAMETARWYGLPVNWNQWAQSPYIGYTDENGSWHEVWFENASSWAGKMDLVNKYNLKGIAIWRMGMEDPAGWKVIQDKFAVDKNNH